MIKYDKKTVNNGLIIACGAVLFYLALQNIGAIAAFLNVIIKILMPFIMGCAIAFILNVPMRAIEKGLFGRSKSKKHKGVKRGVALGLTFLALFGIFALVVSVIIPGISRAVMSIGESLPNAIQSIQNWLLEIEEGIPGLKGVLSTLELDWASISASAQASVKAIATGVLSTGGNLISSIVTSIGEFMIACAFSIYILAQKERLSRQFKQIIYAILPEKLTNGVLGVISMANRSFSSFLTGQVLEACILGSMFVVSMSILHMPYALLIGVLVAITALVPIIGAFAGCIIGALLIAVTSPLTALAFIVLFLVLQQIEGNLIYPHVIGASVGLPSIWILVAVTLGGKLMGIVGMLLFIPLCSILYGILRNFIYARLETRQIDPKKYLDSDF